MLTRQESGPSWRNDLQRLKYLARLPSLRKTDSNLKRCHQSIRTRLLSENPLSDAKWLEWRFDIKGEGENAGLGGNSA
jgi:hypothetical protein